MDSVYLGTNPVYHMVFYANGKKAKIMLHEYDGRTLWYIDEFDADGDFITGYQV